MSGTFAVGIDLGTSNCAVATLDPESGVSSPDSILQQVSADTTDSLRTLPSFLYCPPESGSDWVPGLRAREAAFQQPDRVIHSAKSWLIHSGVDRQGRLLPWQSADIPPDQRLSPVAASTRLLLHLRQDWERTHSCRLADQRVALTIPASFDAAAQQLTLQAALDAGFPDNTLLMEEPQAAFYRWLEGEAQPETRIPEGETFRLLVVDIGGGTSDFSLFELEHRDGIQIRRTAVSDHLLLGGDNLDRFLATRLREQLEEGGTRLAAKQWHSLLAQCRSLKERLLTPEEEVGSSLTLASAGSGLFANSLQAQFDPDTLRSDLLDAFFPECGPNEFPERARGGIRELGLPYAMDGAVTRHLAAFLAEHPPIDLLLCNGGTLNAPFLQQRLCTLLQNWQQGHPVEALEHTEPDLAVARGAAVYASRLEQGTGLIEAGAARSLYLEIQDRKTRQAHPLCVLPQGSSPERVHRVTQPPLQVRVGQPVRFQAYSSAHRPEDVPGDLLPPDTEDLHGLPDMRTQIELPAKSPRPANDLLNVAVETTATAAGLLQVRLVATDRKWKSSGQWELQFQLRGGSETDTPSSGTSRETEAAQKLTATALGKKADGEVKTAKKLMRDLEQRLGKKKEWDPVTCRHLWESLREGLTRRNRSKDHEAVWLNLAGYVLRPGFGVDLDPVRINEIWRLDELGLSFPKESRNRTQLWILWRRVAGGLDAERQVRVADRHVKIFENGGDTPVELLRLTGALERVGPERKQAWIQEHVRRLKRAEGMERRTHLWALGNLLARIPFAGGPEDVVAPAMVAKTFAQIESSCAQDHFPELEQALIRAGRLTGEPAVDLDPEVTGRIEDFLLKQGAAADDLLPLKKEVPEMEADRALHFGESLPPGLTLGS